MDYKKFIAGTPGDIGKWLSKKVGDPGEWKSLHTDDAATRAFKNNRIDEDCILTLLPSHALSTPTTTDFQRRGGEVYTI